MCAYTSLPREKVSGNVAMYLCIHGLTLQYGRNWLVSSKGAKELRAQQFVATQCNDVDAGGERALHAPRV